MKTQEFLTQMEAYFQQEKKKSFLFLTLGVLSAGGALWFWSEMDTILLEGLAWPFFLVGTFQVFNAITIFSHSESLLTKLSKEVVENRPKFLEDEFLRMKTFSRSTTIYRAVEVGLILTGVGLLIIYHSTDDFWLGLGIGLAIQSTLMLAFDFFAETRAERYTENLVDLKEYTLKREMELGY